MNGGADYSTKAVHFAIVDGPKLLQAWDITLSVDLPNRLVSMAKAMRRMKDAGVSCLHLEAPFFAGGAAAVSNANTLSLHRVAYHLEAVFVANGIRVEFVPPSTWRSVVLGNGRPRDPKREAIWYVDVSYKYKTANHNQAEAICIAGYGAILARSRVPNTQHLVPRRRR